MDGTDRSLTGFGAFKVHVSKQLTSSDINILATYFEFEPALREKAQGNGLEFVEKLVERGLITENDISKLLEALEKSGLGGKTSNIHKAFERYRKDATQELLLKSVLAGSSSLEIKEDFFHCTICTNVFVEPKLLPCFHRYCKRCLENLIQKDTVACPLCSYQCPVPTEGVQGFKTDYHMENRIQFKSIKSSFVSETRKKCFGCRKKSIIVTAFCFKCNDFICNDCYDLKLSNDMMADHRDKVKKAKYFQQEQFDFQNYLSLKEPPKCHIHKNALAQKLCYTCNNRPVCIMCSSKEHKEHTLYEINAPDTTDKKKVMAVKEELKKCEGIDKSLLRDIKIAVDKINATASSATERLDKEHESEQRAIQIKVKELTTSQSEIESNLEKNLHDEKASLRLTMEAEIQRVTQEYRAKVQALESKANTEKETLKRNHESEVQKINEKLLQLTAKLKEEKLALNMQKSDRREELSKIRLSAKHLCSRQQNLCSTIKSIDVTNDWTLSLDDVSDASKQLLEDVENTALKLQSLFKSSDLVSDEIVKKTGSVCKLPMFHPVSVVEIKDMKSTTQKIHSIASCGKDRIVITGYDSPNYTFIAVVDGNGKNFQCSKYKAQKKVSARFCASYSMSKVATVSKFNTIGIFDAIDNSYKEDTSNIISTLTSKGRLSCVASDSSNNNIYVGASNLSIYVFNKQLKHTGTVDLSEMSLKSLTGVVVLERYLLVCDKDGKMAYIVTNQKQPKLQRKIDKSGFEGNEYYPMDVCTDNDGFIFILWAPTIPDNGDQIVVKYSQDGSKLLSQQKMEQPVDCITIMKTCHDKDTLVAACKQSWKMSLYAMADPYDNDVPSSCSSQEIHQSLNIPIDNNKSRRQDSGSTIKPTQGVKDKHPKRHLDNDNDGSKKRKVVSDSQSVPRSTNPHTQDARCQNPVENVIYQSKYNIPNNRSTSALRVSDLGASTSGYSSTQPGTTQTVTSEAKVSRFLPPKQQQVLQDSDIPIAKRDIGTTCTKSGVRKQQGNREITLMDGKSSQAPKRTYPTASNRSPLSSRSARNTDVKKIKKEDATSAIPNMPAQRLSGEPVDLFHTEVRKQQGNRENTLDGRKCSQALKRTYPTASNRSPFSSSSVTTKTKAPILLQPKQQVIQCDVRSVKRNIGTTYNKSEASIFSHLKEELSLKLTQTDCGNLGRYFSLPPDQVQTIISSPLYSDKFLLALEERGYINPSNVNRLTDALTELKINHTHLTTKTCMELRDQETEYDTFLAGLSAYLTFSITKKLCDNFEVTDENKNTVISSQNPGLSFLLTIDEMGIINPSDVNKLKSPLEEYRLLQAIAKIHEYQSLVLSDKAMPQDEDKENLFLKCLQQKTKSWFETMTPVPWMKSCQWNSNDLFIASRLVLTNSGSSISSREVDRKCKLHYLDIFTDERLKAETRIILEGQPGSGKTMLSSQLAYDWCCGKLDIPMVIFLPLKIVGNMTIIQAIKMFYIRKGIPITEEDIESMLNSDKKKVYLILDGLEEYNGVTKDGSPSEVMRVMTKEKLSNCIVIITARTDYTKHLPPGPILKIGSFGEDEMTEYIEKVYPDDVKRQGEVKELIDNVPFVLDLCNIPLLFVLLVHNIDRLGKLQEAQLDRVTPFVKAIVDILCPVQDEEDTHSHLSDQKTYITLEELAFNGLCRGNQQLFWQKDFVDRSVTNSKALVDSGILVIEEGTPFNSPDRNLETASGSGTSQTDSISDESLNTSNVTSEIKRGVPLEPDILASINQSESNPILESKEKKSEPLLNRKTLKYISLQVKFLHKLIQEWFAAKYLARLFWGHTSTEHHYKYQLFREHLANIDPADLHYILRFTCHICPASFYFIASFLMRDFKTGDGEIPDYIMNCICLCFSEHDEYKGHKVKNIVREICRRESINFSSGDNRMLLRSKVSMLTFASRSKVPIKRLKFSDVVEKVTDKALVLQDDVWLGILETLEAIEMDRWDQKLIDKDYEDLLKFILNCKHVNAACLLFPSPPKDVTDDKILKALQSRNISVEWTIGANAIHTLDVRTGKWPMEFRLHSRKSNEPSATKAVKDLDTSLSIQSLVNKEGGILEIPGTGVRLEIPSGAIEQECLIQMRIIPISFQKESKSSFTSNSTVVVELLPDNLKLHQLAKLTLPHCLQLKNTGERKAMVYSSHHAKGSKPMWRPKPNLLYQLNDTNCVIWIESFSWETCQIDDRIVEFKTIQVYAACDLDPLPEIIPINVGFYPKLPGERPNEMLILKEIPFLFRKAGNLPLQILFNEVKPMSWKFTGEAKWRLQKIPFMNVVTHVDCQRSFVFEKVGEEDCILVFEVMQEDPVHLIVQFKGISAASLSGSLSQSADAPQPKKRRFNESTAVAMDRVEDVAASSNDTVVAAGLSQSQKRTYYESLAVKRTLENIDREVRTESLRDISENIPKEWKNVGRKLGLGDSELCNLERDYTNHGHTEMVYQMFLYWKQRNGSKATYRVLGEALEAAGRRDLQEKLY